MKRDLICLQDYSPGEILHLLKLTGELKKKKGPETFIGKGHRPYFSKTLEPDPGLF